MLKQWPMDVLESKQRSIVLLRWALILAFGYLTVVDAAASNQVTGLAILLVLALGSNLLLARFPSSWVPSRWFDIGLVLFDSAWVTLGLLWAPQSSSDLFLLYFFVIFVAAVGESLKVIVGSAALVSVVYTLMLSSQSANGIGTTALLRIPFLFAVALFYGYFVTKIRDERRQANESHLRERARIDFLAATSHDLHGPLGNAQSMLELALDVASSETVDRELLMRAQVNVQRVNSLVSNLFQAACLEAGEVQLRIAPMEISPIIRDVLQNSQVAAQVKSIRLSELLEPRLPLVAVDQLQLGRILSNLVDNAIKYTAPGGSVVVSAEATHKDLHIRVTDSGRGMTTEECAAIFAAYRRVNLDDYTPGTGLGLSIAKQLAEALGGSICVASELGAGSTFEVRLPRVDARLDQGERRALTPAVMATVTNRA